MVASVRLRRRDGPLAAFALESSVLELSLRRPRCVIQGATANHAPDVRKWFDLPRFSHAYKRRMPLVLVNGLAEQPESWFANRSTLSRHFDVKVPELLVYDGDALHEQIDAGGEVTVDYLTDRLAVYLDQFVQRPPYNLVGSSLGGQVILTYAIAFPSTSRSWSASAPRASTATRTCR